MALQQRYEAQLGAHHSISPLAPNLVASDVKPPIRPGSEGYVELGLRPVLEGVDRALVLGAMDQWGVPSEMNGVGRTINDVFAEHDAKELSEDYTSIILPAHNEVQSIVRFAQARGIIKVLRESGASIYLMPTVKIVGIEETLFRATRTKR